MARNTPNFNTPIPAKIMTPDRVSSRIGTLAWCGSLRGVPQEDPVAGGARSELVLLGVTRGRVAQRSQFCRRLGGEGIATEAVEVRVSERGQPRDVLVAHRAAAAL